jgi:hypothetical protein
MRSQPSGRVCFGARVPGVPVGGPTTVALAALLCALGAAPGTARAADLETALNQHWRGGWAIVKVPISSDCAGFYTDDDVSGTRVSTKGSHRFDAGELAHVERVGTKMGGRVDVFLDLAEPILEPRHEGPFTLYDKKSCKVQLKVDGAGKHGLDGAEAALAALLELHPEGAAAEASPAWNGRRRDPYPENYDQTLAEYEQWKAAQARAAVSSRMAEAIDEASRMTERMHDDAEYQQGFGEGMARGRDHSFGDCDDAVDAHLYPDVPRGKSDDYRKGYEDGWRLAWDLALLRALAHCATGG